MVKEGLNHYRNPWRTLRSDVRYDNPWIRVQHEEVLNPSGKPGIYGLVHVKNIATGIIPIDENGDTWLVGQYRYPLDQYSWEIPEGGAPEGEDILEAAKRELKQETGLEAKDWTTILNMYTSNCITDERAVAFLAQGITEGQAAPEESEELMVRKLPFTSIVDMVLEGIITDAFSISAILRLDALIRRGHIRL